MNVAVKGAEQSKANNFLEQARKYAPGMALAAGIGLLGWLTQLAEQALFGQAVIEALVMAILLGTLVRTLWKPTALYQPGISFTAKQVLETAIVLLGASVSLPVLLEAGPALILIIVLAVIVGITASMTIGRALGLNSKLAILVACGNSICGNSAIAAVAPVIGASADDIASSIALTAVIGVVVVLTLPLLIPVMGFTLYQYGALAGMTVYAVPQVLAATFSVSALSGQVGTMVKLVRVLMLGPVVIFFSLRQRSANTKLSFSKLVPWFIIGFVILGVVRSLNLMPDALVSALPEVSHWFTIAAMAALGLGVDIQAVRKVGRPVALAVVCSLLVLIVLSITLIKVAGIG